MGAIHLIALGILAEMVVGTSDLSHTQLPQLTKTIIVMTAPGEGEHLSKQSEDAANVKNVSSHITV